MSGVRALASRALLWWFISMSYYGGAQAVGPFTTQKECEAMRTEVGKQWVGFAIKTLPCWWSETRG